MTLVNLRNDGTTKVVGAARPILEKLCPCLPGQVCGRVSAGYVAVLSVAAGGLLPDPRIDKTTRQTTNCTEARSGGNCVCQARQIENRGRQEGTNICVAKGPKSRFSSLKDDMAIGSRGCLSVYRVLTFFFKALAHPRKAT